MKIDAGKPFDMFKNEQWQYIKDNTDKEKYDMIDTIFRYFAGEIKELPEELHGKSAYELEQYYNQHFTAIFSEALINIGKKLATRNPVIEFDLSKLQNYVNIADPTLWYCTECGSTDVEIKVWFLANENEESSGDDSFDLNECWCQECAEHTELEICKNSEYPKVLSTIISENKEEEEEEEEE